jgi:hypothetical protein
MAASCSKTMGPTDLREMGHPRREDVDNPLGICLFDKDPRGWLAYDRPSWLSLSLPELSLPEALSLCCPLSMKSAANEALRIQNGPCTTSQALLIHAYSMEGISPSRPTWPFLQRIDFRQQPETERRHNTCARPLLLLDNTYTPCAF